MFRKHSDDNQSNFWISYADLMAGLLFVFILLIGAIVSKSMIMREDLFAQKEKLGKTEVTLMEKMDKLTMAQKRLKSLKGNLASKESSLKIATHTLGENKQQMTKQKSKIFSQEEKIKLQSEEVRKLHILLVKLQENLFGEKKTEKRLTSKIESITNDFNNSKNKMQSIITLANNKLKLSEANLEKLNQLLLARNSKIDTLSKKTIILQNLTNESNTSLQEKTKKLQEYMGRVIVLSHTLTNKKDELKLKDKKLADILSALDKKKTKYDDLVAKLQSQRAKIRSLTGIKLKVIAALKETLGNNINIDKNSGALRLSSNILFDRGSSTLKEESKTQLKYAFEEYIGALVSNEAIRPYLERIVIEGHTDSDGSYLYNLKLSQERALAVMNYLLSLPIAQKYDLKKYLVASGRAYQDRIMHNGVEDKEASRRIEIKFQLKNEDAMQEIGKILDEK